MPGVAAGLDAEDGEGEAFIAGDSSCRGEASDTLCVLQTQSQAQTTMSTNPRNIFVFTPRAGKASHAAIILALLAGGVIMGVLVYRRASTPVVPAPTPPVVTQQPEKLDDILNAAQSFKRDGEWDKAESLLSSAIAKNAEEQALYVQYAEVFIGKQQPDKAYEQYEKALAIGPRTAELEFAAGSTASAAGRLDRAGEHFGAAQAQNKTDWRAPLFLAQVQVKQNNFDEAKKNLLLATHLKSDLGVAWGTLAEISLRENDANIALQHALKARELEPDSVLWRLVQARALKRLAKPQEALDALAGLDESQRLEPGIMPLIGECYGLLRKPADAASLYAAMSDRFGDRGELSLEAARWFERAGDKVSAKKYAERASFLSVAGASELLDRLK